MRRYPGRYSGFGTHEALLEVISASLLIPSLHYLHYFSLLTHSLPQPPPRSPASPSGGAKAPPPPRTRQPVSRRATSACRAACRAMGGVRVVGFFSSLNFEFRRVFVSLRAGDKYVGVVRAGEGLIPASCFMRSCIMFLRDASREALGTSPASREAGVGFFLVSGAFWIFRGHTCHRSDPSPAADFCVGSRRAFALLGLFAVPVTGTAVISTGVQRANPSRRRPVAR